jgi:tellurite resistance protein TehA-like permease
MIVTSATGSALLPYLQYPNNIIALVVSFLMWSVGQCTAFMVLTIYFWRLMSCNIPPRDAIVSCFIPLGPLGQGSFAIQNMANFLSSFLRNNHFIMNTTSGTSTSTLPGLDQTGYNIMAEIMNWMGHIVGLFLIGFATFWLVEGWASLFYRIPKTFNIGFWGFTFPLGTYCNAVVLAGKDLRNSGFKVWGAAWTVVVILLWIVCAAGTLYKGFWKGELFYAPGLEGWDYDNARKRRDRQMSSGTTVASDNGNRTLTEHASRHRIERADVTFGHGGAMDEESQVSSVNGSGHV